MIICKYEHDHVNQKYDPQHPVILGPAKWQEYLKLNRCKGTLQWTPHQGVDHYDDHYGDHYDDQYGDNFDDHYGDHYDDHYDNQFDDHVGDQSDDHYDDQSDDHYDDKYDDHYDDIYDDHHDGGDDHQEADDDDYHDVNQAMQGSTPTSAAFFLYSFSNRWKLS